MSEWRFRSKLKRLRDTGASSRNVFRSRGSVEITNQALLTHVVDDFARRVMRAESSAPILLDEVLKDLAGHLGVNRDLLLQRLGFIDREVVSVEYVNDAGPRIASGGDLLVCKERVG